MLSNYIKKIIMKYSLFISLLFILVLSGCNSRLPEIAVKNSSLETAEGTRVSLTIYEPGNGDNLPLLVIFDTNEQRMNNWATSAKKIAQSNYRVIVTNADSNAWTNALLKSPVFESNEKLALLGVGSAAKPALAIASADTSISAIITLDAANQISYSKETFAKIPPRPHLVLEASMTPQTPEQKKLDFFNASQEPNKLVWLATDLKGSDIVNSDLEPIVRRTVLMLIDRYLKGKI